MSERVAFYIIVLITISVLILAIGNYQIINALTTTSNTHDGRWNKDNSNNNTHDGRWNKDNSNDNTHDGRKNKDNSNDNTHDGRKNKDNSNDGRKNKDNSNDNTHDGRWNKDFKDPTFSLPFNSNFADQSMKTYNEKNDIIPFP